jgi:hypothetical protein
MSFQEPNEILRRLCLAYPWSSECQAIGPIRPTAAENQGLWHGDTGYDYAKGKNIPTGTRCESVQLIPYEKLVNKQYSPSDIAASMASDGTSVYMQFPTPMQQGIELSSVFPVLAALRRNTNNSFI